MVIRGPSSNQAGGGGEREEIGRIRKAGRRAAEAAERFDPDGGNSPKGERWQGKQSEAPSGGDATGQKQGSRRDRGEPGAGVERMAERARKPGGEGAKEQGQDL